MKDILDFLKLVKHLGWKKTPEVQQSYQITFKNVIYKS